MLDQRLAAVAVTAVFAANGWPCCAVRCVANGWPCLAMAGNAQPEAVLVFRGPTVAWRAAWLAWVGSAAFPLELRQMAALAPWNFTAFFATRGLVTDLRPHPGGCNGLDF